MDKLGVVKSDVTSALSKSHGLGVADLVVVHRVRFPSPPAARSDERRVSSTTGRISSPAWTLRDQHELGSTDEAELAFLRTGSWV